jgi:PAS domain S-box-containing protein
MSSILSPPSNKKEAERMPRIVIANGDKREALELRAGLNRDGYEVAGIAHTGEASVAMSRRLNPDIVLLDIVLPGELDGIDTARILKSELNIPVIYITAQAEDRHIEEAKQTQPLGYIVKPFNAAQVKATLEVALYKRKMEAALRQAHEGLEQRAEARTAELRQANEQLLMEIEERQEVEAALRHSDAILRAVNFAAERLIRLNISQEDIDDILKRLGQITGSSRVYICENRSAVSGRLMASQRYEWTNAGIQSRLNVSGIHDFGYRESGFGRWIDVLSQGQIIFGLVSSFPEQEQRLLSSQDILAIVVVPIFIGDTWWGYMGYDDCHKTRTWSTVEIDALKTAANILGTALQHSLSVRELKESRARYQSILESIEEGYFEMDLKGNFSFFNTSMCEILGYSHSEMMGMNNREYTTPKTARRMFQAFNRIFQTGVSEKIMGYEFIRKDGTRRVIEMSAGLMRDRNGKAIGFRGVGRDVTQNIINQQALRESEERFRSIFTESPIGIRIFDEDGQLIEENKASQAIFRSTGVSAAQLVQLIDEPYMTDAALKKMLNFETFRYEYTLDLAAIQPRENPMGSKNEKINLDILITPLYHVGPGTLWGYLVQIQDITHRKQAEHHVHALTHQLLKTQEDERLRVARDLHDNLAQELSSLRIAFETLFDNQPQVAHDIRQRVSELSGSLQKSIMGVRDMAYNLRPPGLDQLGLVRTVYQYCQNFTERNRIRVDFRAAGLDALKLNADTEINMYRMIQEALNNIIKHANARNVTVRMVASFPKIILRIQDDGDGFDLKARLKQAVNEKRMGLQGMEERVSLLGGRLKIRSQPSKGTSIFIEVPYEEEIREFQDKHTYH